MGLISTMMESQAVVKRPTVGQDTNFGTTSDPIAQTTGIILPCSYQEGSATQSDLYGQRMTLCTATVTFAIDPLVEINDVLQITIPRTGETFPVLVEGEAQPVGRGRMYTVNVMRKRQSPASNITT